MAKLNRLQLSTVRAIGVFLAVLPFIPIQSFFGAMKGIESPATPTHWAWGIVSVSLISLLLIWLSPVSLRKLCSKHAERFAHCLDSSRPSILLTMTGISIFLVSRFAYHHRPHLIDSIVQYFQAKIFAQGALKAPLPPEFDFFMTQHMIFGDEGWYGQYPILHSAILVLGELVCFPWVTQGVMALGSVFFLYRFSNAVFGPATATITILLACFSPFFMFMSGSFMNHIPTLFFISAFLYAFERWESLKLDRYAFYAGITLAAAFLIRPLTAVAFGALFGLFALQTILVRRSFKSVICGVGGFICLAWIFPVYNYLTTGSALMTGYIKLWGAGHGLGFHESPWGDMHTPLHGLRNELVDITLFNEYLFESIIPGLLPLALFLTFTRKLQIWHFRLVTAFLIVPGFYFFYWHRDAFLGPRFLFETLACIFPLSAHALHVGISEIRGIKIGSDSFFRKIDLADFASTVVLVTFIYILTIGIPQRFTIDATSLLTMKRSIVAEAQAAGIKKGVILVKVSWGNRLISRLRGYGVSASQTQRSYNSIDHCMLEELLLKKLPIAELSTALEELINQKMPLYTKVEHSINRDPSLVLSPNHQLTPNCVRQLQYDQTPYTVYLNGLTENSPDLSGDFIVARDLFFENSRLYRHFPQRSYYIYDGQSFIKADFGLLPTDN